MDDAKILNFLGHGPYIQRTFDIQARMWSLKQSFGFQSFYVEDISTRSASVERMQAAERRYMKNLEWDILRRGAVKCHSRIEVKPPGIPKLCRRGMSWCRGADRYERNTRAKRTKVAETDLPFTQTSSRLDQRWECKASQGLKELPADNRGSEACSRALT